MTPTFIYGTAWKEDATQACVEAALAAGFRAIDTANQRKHYVEQGVGRAIAAFPRADLWLQTKFTYRDGQDDRLPYDPSASITDQVAQSFASSLAHLGTDYIDSYVLHGPSQAGPLGAADHEAWRAMEALVEQKQVRVIGVSNISPRQLAELIAFARVPVTYVQNRCYAQRAWDKPVRELCAEHGIVYQGFSLLTANRHVLSHPQVMQIAKTHRRTTAQVVFRFAQQVGMVPLTGTQDPAHMRQDLEAQALFLSREELAAVEAAGSR